MNNKNSLDSEMHSGLGQEVVFPTPNQIMLRRMKSHKGFIFGCIVLIIVLLMAALAPVITWHDPYEQQLESRLLRPVWTENGSWDHPLGTDGFGRDYWSRLVYGSRISLMIGSFCMLIACLIGSTLGLLAGYFGGRVDMVVSYIITVRLALPAVLVALAVVALFGGSMQVVIIVLGCLLWDRFAVVTRASAMQIRPLEYVAAAQSAGCSTLRILLSEVLPNMMNNLIVVMTLEVARAILLEASLSFLGLGVQPPTPSWGLMINEGKDFMLFEPYLITIPGVALLILLLSINLLGDGIRDVTAPEGRS